MHRQILPLALACLLLTGLTFLSLSLPQSDSQSPDEIGTIALTRSDPSPHLEETAPHFQSPLTEALHQAITSGRPVRVTTGDGEPHRYLFRPRPVLADAFQWHLGPHGATMDTQPQSFEGLSLSANPAAPKATLVLAGDSLGMVIRDEAEVTYIRTHPETGQLQARREFREDLQTQCVLDANGTYHVQSDDPLPSGEAAWADATPTQLEPETAALTGVDPASGRLDKYINAIPRATNYDASLKTALLLLVLDKQATGNNTTANLTSKASIYLATVSNVAAAYENQLGIRLLVQEMIMIPNAGDFVDIPSNDAIDDFRSWVASNRSNGTYNWSMASKFGAGLSGQTLGIAFVSTIRNNSSVSVCESTARWDVLAHEIGHNLGSEHSQGGIMNATSLGGSNRNFFTDVTSGETAAKDIYDYARSRLIGNANMRHPEQIPFANQDSVSTAVDTPVTIAPLSNDDTQVRNGAINALSLEEVSSVTPLDAGSATVLGNEVRFEPAANFQGTAWFSYSLRGSVGNNNRGWLHKGDVAVRVGAPPSSLTIDLAPGASYSFVPGTGTSGLTQPAQAVVSQSRDDSQLLIIRVKATTSGTDTFRSGSRTYTLRYTADSPRVTDDRYVYEPGNGPLVFNPLLNDEGAGEPWINPIKPTLGVGTVDHDSDGDELFPTTFRLASVQHRTPEKGTLSTRTLAFVIDGQRDNRLDSVLTFTPSNGATGTALIDYTVEDAVGNEATGLIEIVLPYRVDTLIDTGDTARYHVPADSQDDTLWMLPDFDDSNWQSGPTGLGYDANNDFQAEIDTTLTGLQNTNTSVFVRLPFEAAEVAQYTQLALRLKVDDGFVAYLNGSEVARSSNAVGTAPLAWNALASPSTSDSLALTFATFDLSSQTSLLREGTNVLAIHGLNASIGSSDFLLVPELEASVTRSGIQLISPSRDQITVPAQTWVRLESEVNGAAAGQTVSWETVAQDPSVSIQELDATLHGVRFSSPGSYTLRASTEGALSESLTLDITVVAPGELATGVGMELSVDRPDNAITGQLEAQLSTQGNVAVTWTQISGPGALTFSQPNQVDTTFAIPQEGLYEVRFTATREGITTFDDLVIAANTLADDAIAALVTPVKSTSPTTANLAAMTFFETGEAEASFFLGRTDGATVAGNWEQQLPVGTIPAGETTLTASGLLFETTYQYRLRIRIDGQTAWSDAGQFTTDAAPILSTSLVDESSQARVFVPLDGALGSSWRATAFDDSGWTSGLSGVGYDLDPEFRPWIGTDVEGAMYEKGTSVYIRIPFTLTETQMIEALTLSMRYDDAFIAFLNGTEVARSATAPLNISPAWNTAAAILREDDEAVQLEDYDLTAHRALLVPGENILAIHGLNFIPENRDLLLAPILQLERRQTYYQEWIGRFPGVTALAPLEDNDSDHLTNLLEFALGLDPTVADRGPELPWEWFPSTGGSPFHIHYQRLRDAEERGLNVRLEESPDLQTWGPVDEALAAQIPIDNRLIRVEMPVATPQSELTSRFWRLHVSMGQ